MLTMSGGFCPVTACDLKCCGCHPSLPKLGQLSASVTPKERSWRAQEGDMFTGRCLIEYLYDNVKKNPSMKLGIPGLREGNIILHPTG